MIVPVVPMLETKCVILPSVSRQISGPVVAVVRQRIVGIGELVEDDALPFGAHALGDIARRLHAAGLRREDDFRAERAHRLAPLHRKMLRHHQHHAKAAHRRRHRERDAGVARRRFDQRIARLDLSPLLGLDHHRQRGSILDRPCGIVALELGENDVGRCAGNALQADQRRVAYCVLDRLVHGAGFTKCEPDCNRPRRARRCSDAIYR